MINIVFFGIPAAGKGTQSKLLSEYYNIPHISTGDIFRENMKNKTPLGIKIDALMRAGDLVPDELTNEIVENKLNETDDWILDGYPRTIGQAKLFNEYIKTSCTNTHLFFLHLSEEDVVVRSKERFLKEGRFEDANDEVITKRIKNYYDLTKPAIDYFNKYKNFYYIDASKSIKSIHDQIINILA